MSAWVWLARIRRPQGRKGEVFAEILTDFPEKFKERTRLWLLREPAPAKEAAPTVRTPASHAGGRPPQPVRALALQARGPKTAPTDETPREVGLENHWLHKAGGQSGIVLHFAGVSSITEAEAFAGLIVAVPFEERAALGEDEVHIADLIGCELVDVAGAEPAIIGRIENVDRSAGPNAADAVPLLIVRGNRGEVLVPFAKSFLRKLDVAGARVEMALPEGLLELNG